MKNLLLLTDFSEPSKHAAIYAYSLAKQIQTNLILCNVFIVPAEVRRAGLIVWPLEEADVLLKESEVQLKSLKMQLEKTEDHPVPFMDITYRSCPGILVDVIRKIADETKIDFVVMATHRLGLSALLLGNHTRIMIDDIGAPLFIIPPSAKIVPIQKIAFATDFEDADNDMKFIRKLIVLATALKAEIFITHVYNENEVTPDFYKSVQAMMLDITCANDYPKIYYKPIKMVSNKGGLNWLLVHGKMDLLVLIHHSKGFFNKVLHGSMTQQLAGESLIPLLIFKQSPAPELI